MSDSLSKQIRLVFDVAALRQEAATGLNAGEWRQYQNIREQADAKRQSEQRQYTREYQTRFETESKKLIDDGASRRRALVHRWFGRDSYDKAAIDRQAHRNVLHDHQRQMMRIDEREATQTETLLAKVRKRNQLRGTPQEEFARATNRQSSDTHSRERRSSDTHSSERRAKHDSLQQSLSSLWDRPGQSQAQSTSQTQEQSSAAAQARGIRQTQS